MADMLFIRLVMELWISAKMCWMSWRFLSHPKMMSIGKMFDSAVKVMIFSSGWANSKKLDYKTGCVRQPG